MTSNTNDILTLAEAAEFLRISQYTLREYSAKGYVPGAFRLGWFWRYHRAALAAWQPKGATNDQQ